MKKQLRKWLIAVSVLIFSTAVFAQTKTNATAPWVSDMGYWVLESNIHSPLNHVIRFYNNDHALVYTESLKGIRLNVNRRKVRMKLKKALETTMLSLQENKNPGGSKNFVATLLK